MPLYFLMAIFPCTTGSHCRQVTIFLENVRFRNMRIMTLISIVSWLPMASSTSPFTYGAVEVIFGSIYFYFHLQTAPDLQDCPHSTNLPTIPESTLIVHRVFRDRINLFVFSFVHVITLYNWQLFRYKIEPLGQSSLSSVL